LGRGGLWKRSDLESRERGRIGSVPLI
jgi:hypothetical protein